MDTLALETRNLAIGYRRTRQSNIRLASGLNLRLAPGKLVGLLGPNGVGKSTLLRTLAGMHAPLDGMVLMAGEDVRKLNPSELATRLSLVLTDAPRMGLMTGYELVALGRLPHTDWLGKLSDRDRMMIDWALSAVSATELAAGRVAELSDGQRQKVMIARALAQDSNILLLDEPTAFLDLPRRVETMHLLRKLAQDAGLAIMASTHDLDLALRNCDELWLMKEGAICAGAPEDLVLDGELGDTFRVSGITFDKSSGTFALSRSHGPRVAVAGEGIRANWMRRALERVGYRLANISSAANLSFLENGARGQWQLTVEGRESRHDSIAAVLNALKDEGI